MEVLSMSQRVESDAITVPQFAATGHLGLEPIPSLVVVLGGTGFVGSAIARELIDEGYRVSVAARTEPKSLPAWLAKATFIRLEASDALSYSEVLEGASHVVYSLAGLLPQESNLFPLRDVAETLRPLIGLLEALRSRPDTSMVFLSSGGTIYGNPRVLPVSEDHPTNPITSYGILKLTAEKYIGMYREIYGVKARILRIANAYGPLQPVGRAQGVVGEFIASVMKGSPVRIFGTGRSVRDYIHVDDVALAVAAALKSDGPHILNVGTGVGTSLLQIHQMLQEIVGRRIEIDFFESRGFDVESIVLDAAAYQALTGLTPVELRTGLHQTWRDAANRGILG
jgi:UDP-glucose 4-epimerase